MAFRSVQEELGDALPHRISPAPLPGPPLSAVSLPSRPLPAAPCWEVGTAQGGHRRPARGGVSTWAPAGLALGRAGSCPESGPGSPSPRRGTEPASLRFPRPAEGAGSLAGLQGWAGGFPLWAVSPPGSFPSAPQAEERGALPPLARPPPSPAGSRPPRPQSAHTGCTGCTPAWSPLAAPGPGPGPRSPASKVTSSESPPLSGAPRAPRTPPALFTSQHVLIHLTVDCQLPRPLLRGTGHLATPSART